MSCEDCMEKDRIAHEGLNRWNAFHLQERLELGEAVDISGLKIQHVQRYREDGE